MDSEVSRDPGTGGTEINHDPLDEARIPDIGRIEIPSVGCSHGGYRLLHAHLMPGPETLLRSPRRFRICRSGVVDCSAGEIA